MNNELKRLVEELVQINGPSGFELPVATKLRDEMQPYSDSIEIDPIGNVIAKIAGKTDKTIMVTAHTDEISLVVERVVDDLVFVKTVGMIDEAVLASTPVIILTEKGPVPGIMGSSTAHLKAWAKPCPPFIDVGGNTKAILPGDPVVFAPNVKWLSDNLIASKALDDRIGCAILVELARLLTNNKPENTIYLVGSVQEEVKVRGASYLAQTLAPQYSIVIDTLYGADPTLPTLKTWPIGNGPVIRRFEQSHSAWTIGYMSRTISRALGRAGEELGVPFGYDVAETFTDPSGILGVRPDLEACSINIARRYSHSPHEIVDIRDVEWTLQIVERALNYL